MKRIRSILKDLFPRKIALTATGALLIAVVAVTPAYSQFGLDTAAILAGLKEINSTLTSAVAGPLKIINQVEQEEQQYMQDVVYPMSSINSAKQLATSFTNSFSTFRQLGSLNISSATLPNPQQLEQQMLSGDPNNITSIAGSYQNVFAPLPAQAAIPQNIEYQIDMGDAQAQDALKKAIELDALAEREMEVAQKLNTQIAASAPGTASILDAEASAWVVQANAYSQMGMAELLRLNSSSLSNRSGALKDSTTQMQNLNQRMLNIVTPPGQ